MKRWIAMLLVVSTFSWSVATAFAQDGGEDTCPTLVQTAYDLTRTACKSLGRDQACYGNINIQAEPRENVFDFNFSQTGDLVDVNAIESLQLSSMDITNSTWGISLMRIRANIEEARPENVELLLFGNVEVFQAESSQGELPTPTLQITLMSNVNLRSDPSTNNPPLASLAGGTVATAIARNETSDWIQVQIDDESNGWLYVPLLTIEGDVSILPVFGVTGSASEAQSLSSGVQVEVYQYSVLRSAPDDFSGGYTFDVTMTIPAIGRNTEGTWIQVQTPTGEIGWLDIGWVFVRQGDPMALPVVASDGEVAPTLTVSSLPESTAPMQAFYFRSGVADRPCDSAPDSGILIQTPEGVGKITLYINEVIVELGSTIYVQNVASDLMAVSLVDGSATVSARGVDVSLLPGTQAIIPIDPVALIPVGAPIGPVPYETGALAPLPIGVLSTTVSVAPAPSTDTLTTTLGYPTVGDYSFVWDALTPTCLSPSPLDTVLISWPDGPMSFVIGDDGSVSTTWSWSGFAFGPAAPDGTPTRGVSGAALTVDEPGVFLASVSSPVVGGGDGLDPIVELYNTYRFTFRVAGDGTISGEVTHENIFLPIARELTRTMFSPCIVTNTFTLEPSS